MQNLVKYDVIDQYLELHFCQTAQGLIFLTVFNKNISYSLIIIKLWLTYMYCARYKLSLLMYRFLITFPFLIVQTVRHNSTVQNLHTNYSLWLDTKEPNSNCKTRNMWIVNLYKRFDEWNFWWSKNIVKVARLKRNCSEISIFVIQNVLHIILRFLVYTTLTS